MIQTQQNLFGYTPSLFDIPAAKTTAVDEAMEAAAYAALMEEVFGSEEDEEGLVEMLAYEAEVAEEYRLMVKYARFR